MKRALAVAALLACATIARAQAPVPVISQIAYNNPTFPGQVITLNGVGFTGATQVKVGNATDGAFSVVNDTEIVWTAPVDGPPGGAISVTTPAGISAPFAVTVVVAPYAPSSPACLPNTGNVNTLFNPSTGNTIVALWCDVPGGTYHYALAGSTSAATFTQSNCLSTVAPFSVSLVWVKQAWAACVDHVMSASDQAYADRLAFQFVPRPTVKGTGPQTIFTAAANGGLGSPLIMGTPQAFQTIAGGTTTGGLRLPGGNVTRYCDVGGITSIQGNVIPAKSYAACTLVFPPPGGFQYPATTNSAFIVAPTDTFLVDNAHNLWGIDAKGIITVNGIEDPTSAGVVELAWVGGLIWQKNSNNLWWSKTAPSAAWLPAGGTATAPL